MQIRNICQRCRHEYGGIAISGGNRGMNQMMMAMSGMTTGRTLCTRCSGWVYPVEDGNVLPLEFRPSLGRMTLVVLSSAGIWGLFTLVAALGGVVVPEDAAVAKKGFDGYVKATYQLSLCGAAIGTAISLLIVFLALRRHDVNRPHPAGMMQFGQAATMVQAGIISVGAGILLTVVLLPSFSTADFALRSPWMRGLVGAMQGLLAASASHAVLFKVCRRVSAR